MTDDEVVLPYSIFKEYMEKSIDDFENWFLINPVNGDMWLVPVEDITSLAFGSGCIIPHKRGWLPNFDDGRYTGCVSDSGRLMEMQVFKIGSKVVRGPSWKWGSQGSGGIGKVVSVGDLGEWVWVKWPNGEKNDYRWAMDHNPDGGYGIYDLKVIDSPMGDLDLMKKYKRVRISV